METTVRGNGLIDLRSEAEGKSPWTLESSTENEGPICGETWAADQQEHRLASLPPQFRHGEWGSYEQLGLLTQ